MAQLKIMNIIKGLICKAVFFLIIGFLIYSCKTDCYEISEVYRYDNILIIVERIPDSTDVVYFRLNGISLKTGKDTIYNQEARNYCQYYKYISIGDTIIKKKGELIFSIHKKDTVLNFNWECEGNVYK